MGKHLMKRTNNTRNDLVDIVSQLSDIMKTLEERVLDAETPFISLGEAVQSTYFQSLTLKEHISTTLSMVDGDGDQTINNSVRRLVSSSIEQLESCKTDITECMENDDTIVDLLKDLEHSCSTMYQIALYLNIISVNIRVTASNIAGAGTFASVSETTRLLSKDIQSISNEILDKTLLSLREHTSMFRDTYKENKNIRASGRRAEKDLHRVKRTIDSITLHSKETLTDLDSTIHEITDKIGDIVVSIQFHDRMRQRVEHVNHGLSDTNMLLNKFFELDKSHSGDDVVDPLLKEAYLILSMQADQITSIIRDLTGVYQDGKSRLHELLHEISSLPSLISADKSNSINLLKEIFENYYEIVSKAVSVRDTIISTAVKSAEHSAEILNYLSTIRSWGHSAKLVSLNATIMSAKLGSGGGSLTILSQDIVRQAAKLQSVITHIEEIVHAINTDIENMKTGENTESNSMATIEEKSDELTGLFDTYTENLTTRVQEYLLGLTEKSKKGEEELSFIPQLIDELGHSQKVLEKSKSDLLAIEPSLEHEMLDRSALLETLSKSYTMEEERLIHERYFGKSKPSPKSSPKPVSKNPQKPLVTPPQKSSENIDLFDDSAGDEVTLFDDSADDVTLFDDSADDVTLFDDSADDVTLFDDSSGDDVTLFDDSSDDVTLFDDSSGDDVTLFDDSSGDDVTLFDELDGDDVTLFDESDGDDVTLFDEDESSESETKKNASKDEEKSDEFDDNIELF